MNKPIIETGRWGKDIFGKDGWQINYSSILSKLIVVAGQNCTSYASDLFIQWTNDVEKHLSDESWTGGKSMYGFRESGVDHMEWIQNGYSEYKEIYVLMVTITGDEIKMELSKED